MIQQAVILAAGKGSRINADDPGPPKPLHKVAGLTLIKRTLLTLARAGVTRAYVVIGFRGDEIKQAITGDPDYARANLVVEFVDNPEYEKNNGVSLLHVKGHVTGPFILSMSDHVYDVAVPKAAAAADMSASDLVLCIDRRAAEVYDPDDATKVKTDGTRIVDIGKQITDYDSIDCGVFAIGPGFLDALEEVRAEKGDCSLSDGVKRLAQKGRAGVADIGNVFWQDVDTVEARARAQREIFRALRKPVDGPVSRHINRKISLTVTRLLLPFPVTPNQMTIVANAIGFVGVWLVLQATFRDVIIGASLMQVQSILDGCDGEIARLKFKSSRFGEWLDNVLDDTLNVLYCYALGHASSILFAQPAFEWLGLAGGIGYAIYLGVLYQQLAVVHRSGNPFLFRWWFQRDGADIHTTFSRPGLATRIGAFVRALSRRDVFLLCFLGLAIAHQPQVAALWYGIIGVGHLGMSVVHLLSGGLANARRLARQP